MRAYWELYREFPRERGLDIVHRLEREREMYKEKTVGVVVPAYNEEGLIGEVIRTVPEFVDRVYVVDDASTDGTWREIKAAAAELNDERDSPATATERQSPTASDGGVAFERTVVPIQHDENRGPGGAIKTGYLHALEDEIDVVAVMGGDAQMDPSYLNRLLDPVVEGEVDYAKGNRLLSREYRQAMPRFRFFGNFILTFLTKLASGYLKMMDPQNGYTAISRKALERVEIESMYEGFGYCNDLLVKLNAKGMRMTDIPMPAVYGNEESSIDYLPYIRNVSTMLFRDFLWRLKIKYLILDFHPLALFYLLGLVSVGFTVLGSVWSIYAVTIRGLSAFVGVTVNFLFFFIGCLFILLASAFEIDYNEDLELERQNRRTE